VQLDVTLPSATGHGEIGLAPWAGFAGRLALNLVLTLSPYAGLRLWRRHGAWDTSAERPVS
jgi:hypothetical protein